MGYEQDQAIFRRKNSSNIEEFEKNYTNIYKLKPMSTLQCKQLYDEYGEVCDEANKLGSIQLFFDTDFYQNTKKLIENSTNYKELKSQLDMYNAYKDIYNQMQELEEGTTLYLEDVTVTCIKKRIEYKYKCMRPEDRDISHNKAILHHVFNLQRSNELKKLFLHLKQRMRELKIKQDKDVSDIEVQEARAEKMEQEHARIEEERKKEDERRRIEDKQIAKEKEEIKQIRKKKIDLLNEYKTATDIFIPAPAKKQDESPPSSEPFKKVIYKNSIRTTGPRVHKKKYQFWDDFWSRFEPPVILD
jgi:hypothetical protein